MSALEPQGAVTSLHIDYDKRLMLFSGRATPQLALNIAGKLGVSIRTVDTHRENIKHKLDLKNASELLQCAIEWTRAGT